MKLFAFLTLSFFLAYGINAQDKLLDILPLQGGKVDYTEVVHVDSVSKNELYARAKLWLVDTYKSSINVIQLEDKENGEIIGKGFSEIDLHFGLFDNGRIDVIVWQTIKIQTKDSRYKFEITDFRLKYLYPSSGPGFVPITHYDKELEQWDADRKFFVDIDNKVKGLIESLKSTMKKPIDKNW